MFDETVALFWFLACFNFQLVTFQDQQTKQKQKLPVQDPHWVILMGISFFVVYFGIASTKDSQQIIIGGRNSLNKKNDDMVKVCFQTSFNLSRALF